MNILHKFLLGSENGEPEWMVKIDDTDTLAAQYSHIIALKEGGCYFSFSIDKAGVSTTKDGAVGVGRIDRDGVVEWIFHSESPTGDVNFGFIVVDSAENLIWLHDDDHAGNDPIVTKFSPSGVQLYQKQLDWSGVTYVSELLVDSDDNIYIAGNYDSWEGFVVKYSPDLTALLWDYVFTYSTVNADQNGVSSICLSPDESKLYFCGNLKNAADVISGYLGYLFTSTGLYIDYRTTTPAYLDKVAVGPLGDVIILGNTEVLIVDKNDPGIRLDNRKLSGLTVISAYTNIKTRDSECWVQGFSGVQVLNSDLTSKEKQMTVGGGSVRGLDISESGYIFIITEDLFIAKFKKATSGALAGYSFSLDDAAAVVGPGTASSAFSVLTTEVSSSHPVSNYSGDVVTATFTPDSITQESL